MKITALAFATALATLACSEQKDTKSPQAAGPPKSLEEQCSNLSKVVNAQQTAIHDDIGNFKAMTRQEQFYAAADRLKKASEAIAGSAVSDPRLAEARDRYAKVYDKLSTDANLAGAGTQGND